ncbi:HYD1 signature containing ADP-ribosyltransferase family protein [Nocardia alba]|uniref:HYD1 signature containing ADP-ribosyltransferase family protein n=1 Tax=Nocardia alba TaxID=225051 RepID=UPI001A9E41B7|nr:HYD1 signature containing ADP-ribosyltransferase family protein [Nocardia alba]
MQQPVSGQTQYPGLLDPVQFVQSYKPEQARAQDDPQQGVPAQVVVTAAVSIPADPGPCQVPRLTSATYSAPQLAADKALVQQGRPNWVGPGNPYDAAVARLKAAEYTRYQQLLDLQWSQYRPQNEEEAESWRAAFRRLREGGIAWKDPAVQQWTQTQLQQGVLTDPRYPPKWAGPPVNVSPTSPELHPLDKPISAAVVAIAKSTKHSLVVLGDTVVNLSPHAEMRATINARPDRDGKINAPVVPTRPEHSPLEVAIALVDIGSYVVPIGAPARVAAAAGTKAASVGAARVAAEAGAATTRSLPVHMAEATTLPAIRVPNAAPRPYSDVMPSPPAMNSLTNGPSVMPLNAYVRPSEGLPLAQMLTSEESVARAAKDLVAEVEQFVMLRSTSQSLVTAGAHDVAVGQRLGAAMHASESAPAVRTTTGGGLPTGAPPSRPVDGSLTPPSGSIPRQTLYHYTTEGRLSQILNALELWASRKADNPKDARYGDGQYLSDIEPGTLRPGQLSYRFLSTPRGWRRFTHYIEVDVTGLTVIAGREGVFLIPNSGPLDLTGRIVRSGKNMP